ncbi:APC family permease [Candidatus Woesebacteria bacterium]|nr:APC family permease [Candidatus Woesebacteria bacterium]
MAEKKEHGLLDAFSSTAIAGNDILSSCLYVCGIAIIFAGVWAPLVFVVIGLVLYLYKHVYTEVVEALPLNGGAYNCLLNASTKSLAAVAGVMTTLSYVATSVISAKTASEYVHTVWHGLPVLPMTAGIIVFFAILVILGVKDSAKVAKGIFTLHIFTLTLFVTIGVLGIVNNGVGFLAEGFFKTQALFAQEGAAKMLFFAFSASLLGVSGFESSANFVEEQAPGVFRKTLKSMLLGVVLFNPLITIVVLQSLDLNTIAQVKDFVLADSALQIGGVGLKYLIVADAFLVLSGAVLASFVGASGLLYRMTLDHCLPSTILLPKLRSRNQNTTRIIIAFALLCLSILFVTKGALLSLAGVYTISFLGVMTLFAFGNVILRMTRPDLKRTYRGPLLYAFIAAAATGAGIVGNILIDPKNLVYFLTYFIPAIALVMTMIFRDYVLEALLHAVEQFPFLYNRVRPWFEHVIRPRIILFAHHPHKLYHSLEYIRKNETSRNITVVFCKESGERSEVLLQKFEQYIATFKEASVFENLSISLVVEEQQTFGPEVVKAYANRYRIQRNNVFIGSIHDSHDFSFEQLGGVRIIQ